MTECNAEQTIEGVDTSAGQSMARIAADTLVNGSQIVDALSVRGEYKTYTAKLIALLDKEIKLEGLYCVARTAYKNFIVVEFTDGSLFTLRAKTNELKVHDNVESITTPVVTEEN